MSIVQIYAPCENEKEEEKAVILTRPEVANPRTRSGVARTRPEIARKRPDIARSRPQLVGLKIITRHDVNMEW